MATPHLNGGYTIFGQCDDATVALVKQIAHMATDPANDRPFRPVKILHIKIVRAGAAAKTGDARQETCGRCDPNAVRPRKFAAFADPWTAERLLFLHVKPSIAIERIFMTRQPGLYATFETSEGNIVCRLFDKEAPKTVANFVELAEGKREWTHPSTHKKSNDRLYDGTIFHRVIPDFMIQGGDPQGSGMGGPGYQFEDETKGSPHKLR